jgi:hypothetical protein
VWCGVVQVLFVDESAGEVLWSLSKTKLNEQLAKAGSDSCPVITGFIASTPEGVATTLKRDGRYGRTRHHTTRHTHKVYQAMGSGTRGERCDDRVDDTAYT